MRPSARLVLAGPMAALTLIPATAHAAPAPLTPTVREDNGRVQFSDVSAGSPQRLTVARGLAGNRRVLAFTDAGSADLVAGGDCRRTEPHVVQCPEPSAARLQIFLKGLDDAVRVGTGLRLPLQEAGGDGNDHLQGASADDDLDGGSGDDVLDGGGGADDFRGGPGTDTADFSARPPGSVVRVTLGDEEVDGDITDLLEDIIKQTDVKALNAFAAGTITLGGAPPAPAAPRVGDNVHGDVENVTGGAGGDDLVGNGAANVLTGGPGADSLEGKGGADVLDGGEGDDVLVSRDGAVDTVACGPGADRVVADPEDRLAADCERDDNGAAPGERPGGAVAGTPPEAAIVTRVVQVSKRGVARLRVRCVYRAQRCRGPVRLVAAASVRVRVGKRTLRVRANQVLASANAEIPWGTSTGVTLRVGSKVRQVLARRRRGLRARATARLSDSAAPGGSPVASIARNVSLIRKG